jgi:phosphatidylserine/phosphatidylglycerophosphate/cardiolipin synthase-like enzyme
MRSLRVLPASVALGLLAPLLAVAATSGPAQAGPTTSAATASAAVAPAPKKKAKYKPPVGAVFNDPLIPSARGNVLDQVTLAVRNTPKKHYIRLVVWNYDAPWLTSELIRAKKRGAIVQVITAGSVDSGSFRNLARFLLQNPKDKSFAKKCKGACRSNSKIMHSKVFMFSKVGRTKNVAMFGSTNLTGAARNRQWNDQITTTNKPLYEFFVKTFEQYRKDRPQVKPGDGFKSKRYEVVLFPKFDENPVAKAFSKVRCNGATGPGATGSRTKIRIAVAGWFNGYGEEIAQKVRQLWDRGCDIRIVTTLLGRGVNRALRNPAGRGPVPIHSLYQDVDDDGVPERYLHMKSVSIQGVYGGNTNANLVWTGSPNWSARAARSDEVWVKVFDAPVLARRYAAHIDRLRTIILNQGDNVDNDAARLLTKLRQYQATRAAMAKTGLVSGPALPDWLELD